MSAPGLNQPIGIVFIGPNDAFVLEKASGQVKRVIGGVVQATPVLDLAVNSNSERGLLSLVLHPNFPATPFVYIRWTESSTGADSGVVSEVPLLGNRVDRFIWNGSTLTMDRNLILLRSRQTDNIAVPGHPGTTNAAEQANHNGGVLRFGPDGKLYLFMGDQGRRGWLQNLPNGPFLTPPQTDDTFGGPAPDNAHFTGVILRLNEDGTTPADNPFFAAGAAMGGEVGANIQKIFSYGHRNGFGMAFDPVSGSLWETENADDAFSELNRIVPGMNGGWIQLAGPLNRLADYKQIETTLFGSATQQVRYPPTRAAYTAALALSRMFMLPGAVYRDPEFSWKYEIGPAGTTFVSGNALGAEYNGTLWIGSARSFQQVGGNGGSLYRMRLTADRLHVDVSADPRLADLVADNLFRAQKVRWHGKRDAANRTRFWDYARYRTGAGRRPLRSESNRQRHLPDQPDSIATEYADGDTLMTRWFQLKPVWLSATLVCALSSPAMAGLITNGGFESGFSSWTRTDQLGSEGTFALQTGTTSPVNGDPVPAPPGGTTAAMTDAQGPGSHVLSQSFTVSAPVLAAMLRFDVFVGNRAGMFVSPSTLDFSTPALNQQARVDILLGSAGAFSVLPADVLLNAFQTNPGDRGWSPGTHTTRWMSPH